MKADGKWRFVHKDDNLLNGLLVDDKRRMGRQQSLFSWRMRFSSFFVVVKQISMLELGLNRSKDCLRGH